MKHEDFEIGKDFYTQVGRWRCTDKGTRTVVAIFVSKVQLRHSEYEFLDYEEASKQGWFNGPPYTVLEDVFDENDFEGCSLTPKNRE